MRQRKLTHAKTPIVVTVVRGHLYMICNLRQKMIQLSDVRQLHYQMCIIVAILSKGLKEIYSGILKQVNILLLNSAAYFCQ